MTTFVSDKKTSSDERSYYHRTCSIERPFSSFVTTCQERSIRSWTAISRQTDATRVPRTCCWLHGHYVGTSSLAGVLRCESLQEEHHGTRKWSPAIPLTWCREASGTNEAFAIDGFHTALSPGARAISGNMPRKTAATSRQRPPSTNERICSSTLPRCRVRRTDVI